MATIYDVARMAGVSTYTVSAVVNRSAKVSPELTERVNQAVVALQYTANEVARSLPLRRTRTVGMLIPDIANPFYAKVVRGVGELLRENDYTLQLASTYNSPEQQAAHLRVFRAKQADGLIVFFSGGDEAVLRGMVKSGKALVFAGRTPATFEADCVVAENRLGARLATAHLIEKGHRRIANLSGQMMFTANIHRDEGWRAALMEQGIEPREAYLGVGDWTAESAERLMKGMLALPEPPTAVLTANFLMMTGALRASRAAGLRCPEDLEIVSWDDSDWLDVFSPPITTVVTSSYAMGRHAATLLLERLADASLPPRQVILQPELRIRS
ncbi:MAG: LacI family DNA-binding transcriptional regulator [Bryobacteraceae bacterium]